MDMTFKFNTQRVKVYPQIYMLKPKVCTPSDIHMFHTDGGPHWLQGNACVWPPKQDRGEPKTRTILDEPVLATAYRAYLEQRGRFQRTFEVPRDSIPITLAHAAEIYHNSLQLPAYHQPNYVDHLLTEWHLCERARYIPPSCKLHVIDAE